MVALLAGGVVVGAAPVARSVPRAAPEVPVTAADRGTHPANNSPVLASDPTDPAFVVEAHRVDAPDFGCALAASGDSGRGWVPVAPLTAMPAGAEKCYAPEVAFDGSGRLYYLFVGLAGPGNRPMGAFLTYSDDRARTFSPPRQVLGPLRFGVRLAVDRDRGRLHLVWLQPAADPGFGGFADGDNPVRAAFSDDGGLTFSEPVRVSDPSRRRVVAPALAMGPGGAVHVAYYDLGADARDYQGLPGPRWEGRWSVVVSSSADGGRTFGAELVVDDRVVAPERVMLIFTMPPPALAVAGRRLCLAWTDARNGDPDVLLRCSGPSIRRWQQTRRLNDDPLGNGRHQNLPRLAASPDGRLDAVFYDRRADAANRMNDVAYTFSVDSGRTFSPNVRLTTERSNPLIGPRYAVPSADGQTEFGGRLGLLATQGGALAAWADTRNGTGGRSGQDIFAAEARPDPDRWRAGTLPSVLAGLGALAVWGVLGLDRRGRRGRSRGQRPA